MDSHGYWETSLLTWFSLFLWQESLARTTSTSSTPTTLGCNCTLSRHSVWKHFGRCLLVCVCVLNGTYFGTLGDSDKFSRIPFGIDSAKNMFNKTMPIITESHNQVTLSASPLWKFLPRASALWRWLTHTDWICTPGGSGTPRIVHKIVWESWKQKQRPWSCNKPWSVHPFGLSQWNCKRGGSKWEREIFWRK